MNCIKSFILLILMSMVVSSCQKDKSQEVEIEENIHYSSSLESRGFNGDSTQPFYQAEYVKNELGLNIPRVVSSQKVYDMMNELNSLSYQSQIVDALEGRDDYPCWSCGEVDYNDINDVHFTIVPIIDITERKVEALIG